MNVPPKLSASRWPLIIVIIFFVLITMMFIVAFVTTTESEMAAANLPTLELSEDVYVEQVATLLQSADVDNGAELVETYGCAACHRIGVASNVAPSFEGVAERAATRRPPLSAADYLYESIIHPTAYVVEGYEPAMPQNYPERMSEQEIGDIIAYLLTPTAH